MRITFLFSDNFPGNSAYSNRIHSMAKGLVYYNNVVIVAVVYPGYKDNSTNDQKWGEYDGVRFKYYTKQIYKPQRRLQQVITGINGIFKFFVNILFSHKKNSPDFIISCSSSLIHLFFLYLLKIIKGIKLLREYNEYPKFVLQKSKNFFSIRKYILLDGFIFMTHKLQDFFEHELKIKKKSIIIHMTVDEDRFTKINQYKKTDFITLMGDVVGEKDGVELLIKSFKEIHKEFPKIKLRLVGDISNNTLYKKRVRLIKDLDLSDYIYFTGVVNRENIPLILEESKFLLLPRTHSLQSESGFPTKLGEYLMSSTPVVVTNTGEISGFLRNKENAFICEADSIKSYSESVIYALSHYNEAIKVGIQGKITAEKNFSYKSQGKVLNDFLKTFII